jgi:multicomponent Na+:H+ antiporter subunit D
VFLFLPIIILAIITITIGLNVEPFFKIAEQASSQLLNQTEYINAVLGNIN